MAGVATMLASYKGHTRAGHLQVQSSGQPSCLVVFSPQGKEAFLISLVSYFATGELKQSSWHPIPYRGEKKISSFYLGQSE